MEDLKYNLDIFFDELIKMKLGNRNAELSKMGWQSKKYFKKQFVRTVDDKSEIIKKFDAPPQVKSTCLEAV